MVLPVLEIRHVPIQVFWRALDLYGSPRHSSVQECQRKIAEAEDRLPIDDTIEAIDPFSMALAEYMSSAGAFSQVSGEFSGHLGYRVIV